MQESRLYSGIVGSLQYLLIDRCDMQFETNACAKKMKQPTEASWTRLKRLARYLAGTESARVVLKKPERLGWECKGQEKSIKLEN